MWPVQLLSTQDRPLLSTPSQLLQKRIYSAFLHSSYSPGTARGSHCSPQGSHSFLDLKGLKTIPYGWQAWLSQDVHLLAAS